MVAMLRYRLIKNARLTGYKQFLFQKRYVFMPRGITNAKIKRNQGTPKGFETWNDLDSFHSINFEDSEVLEKKIRKLQKFTKSLRQKLSSSKNHVDMDYEILDDLDKADLDRDADEIYKSIATNNETPSLFHNEKEKSVSLELDNLTDIISQTQAAQATSLLPKKVQEIINNDELIIKNLSNKTKQNWNPIIEQLYLNKDKINKLSNKNFKKLLTLDIRNLSFENINKLDEILSTFVNNELEIFSFSMYNCLPCKISLNYLI